MKQVITSIAALWLILEGMATELDPGGVELRGIRDAVDLRSSHVLEIGAGTGRLTFAYATTAKWVIGIDPKQGDVEAATTRSRTERLDNVRFVCGSATALPLPAEAFDVVLFASSL